MIVKVFDSDGETELGSKVFSDLVAGNTDAVKLFLQNNLSRELINLIGSISQYSESDMYTFMSWALDIETLSCPFNVSGSLVSSGTLETTMQYYYRVTAYNSIGETTGSIEISVTTDTVNKSILIEWDEVPGAVGYRIYRSTDQDYTEARIMDYIGTPSGWLDEGIFTPSGFDLPIINTTAATGGVNYGTAPTGSSFTSDNLAFDNVQIGEQKIFWLKVSPGVSLLESDNPRTAILDFYEE